jgi:tRNA (uracil-5-)-methyltransferase TRM9
MKVSSQRNIWDKIALDWYTLKVNPDKRVSEFLNRQKGNIVDFGSGAGRHLIESKTKGKIFLVDFSKEMINFAMKRAKKLKINSEFYISDLKKTPFADNFFNAAIFTAVLHCIPGKANRKKIVKELFRILKPGAQAIVSVWNKDSSWFKRKPKEICMSWKSIGKRYYYLYDRDEIYNLFEDSGFKISKKFEPDKRIMFICQKPK